MSSKKKSPASITIGVLGFQGDIEENIAATNQALREMQIADGDVKRVRYPDEIEKVDGLIIPGGESTVQSTLAAIQQSLPVIKKAISEG
ncbi:MAG TPA: pyridoxal 5'-phosphate synthase glutaminase subunit PdxT, partial [Nitrososphaera sp.]|nr:pyridoxal 5'-phosphate synthase glutaminase subunit PdxT [Nitrososphaera sp.]